MVRLEAPELLMLKYGSMSFSPFTVNRFDVPGSPLRLKFPYPPVTFTVTPGTVKATLVMPPPPAGNCASCCGENGVFMLGSGFTSGAIAETSTVCVDCPTDNVRLSVTTDPTATSVCCSNFWKPEGLVLTIYVPVFSKRKRNSPLESVMLFCVDPVSRLFRVTVAFGTTAPLGSLRVPAMSPVVSDWAKSAGAINSINVRTKRTVPLVEFLDIRLPPQEDLGK